MVFVEGGRVVDRRSVCTFLLLHCCCELYAATAAVSRVCSCMFALFRTPVLRRPHDVVRQRRFERPMPIS